MGRPVHRRPRRGLNRRDFLRRASWLPAAVAAAPAAQALTTRHAPMAAGAVFAHGVASGDPLSDRIVFWTRVSGSQDVVDVRLEIARDAQFGDLLRSVETATDGTRDHTVKLDVAGLPAGTTVYYRFLALGQVSPTGRSRTLPTGPVGHLRLAVVSCSSYPHGYFNAYARIAQRADLDAVLHVGDYIYEYAEGGYGNVRSSQPAHEIVTLQDYRTRHAQYKADADLQALHRQHPVIAMWDDHETANNAWTAGAENHDDGEGDWNARVAAALQAYFEWLPVREPTGGDLKQNNKRFEFGDLLDIHTLETRLTARDAQLPANQDTLPVFTQTGDFDDASRTLIGAEQQQWLAAGLKGGKARWHLIAQAVMMSQLKVNGFPNRSELSTFVNPDQWDGYNPERERLFATLANDGQPIDNVVILAGDIHSAWAADLTPDPNNPRVRAGGYDPATGAGSRAVEFVTTSVTSPSLESNPGLADALVKFVERENPHFKYAELTQKGYLLLDVDPRRIVGEFWYVDTVAEPSSGEALGAAFATFSGANHLVPVDATPGKRRHPPLAV